MLSRVTIQNFKSIGEPGVDMELKPLTFLVGPNGAGKSSIVDAISFASQRGVRRTPREESITIDDVDDVHFRQQPNTLRIQVEAPVTHSDQAAIYTLSHFGGDTGPTQIEHVFYPAKKEGVRRIAIEDKVDRQTELTGESVMGKALFNRAFPIRATRGYIDSYQPRRDSLSVKPEVLWVGQLGQNTLEVLDRLRNAKFTSQRSKIEKWSSKFGMPYIAASLSRNNLVEGSYADEKLDAPLNLYLASSGGRQVLPVIVQLFWPKRGSIIMIEEPEISLHPQAQIDVLEMFAEALKEDKQIIATTHSHILTQALGYAVNKGWLKADQIAVYHIEKKKKTGTIAKQLKVKKTGYIDGWIPSFNKVERQMLREWAKTLPRE